MKYEITIWIDDLNEVADFYDLPNFYRKIITSWDEEKNKYKIEIYG